MELVLFEKRETTGIITINQPQALNALSSKVLGELNQALNQVQEDKSLRAVLITGQGEKAFVAGADIKEIHSLNESSAREFAELGQKVFSRLEALPLPVIAAVNGFALGGGLELAMACDFIYAADKAKLGLPECTLGLMPGFGGSVRLARKVGPARAMEMTLTGAPITAQEALAFGLVNRVVPGDQLLAACLETAAKLAKRAPLALAAIKKTILDTYGVPSEQAMGLEAAAFAKLFHSQDCKEGTEAFLNKRQPEFKGH